MVQAVVQARVTLEPQVAVPALQQKVLGDAVQDVDSDKPYQGPNPGSGGPAPCARALDVGEPPIRVHGDERGRELGRDIRRDQQETGSNLERERPASPCNKDACLAEDGGCVVYEQENEAIEGENEPGAREARMQTWGTC